MFFFFLHPSLIISQCKEQVGRQSIKILKKFSSNQKVFDEPMQIKSILDDFEDAYFQDSPTIMSSNHLKRSLDELDDPISSLSSVIS